MRVVLALWADPAMYLATIFTSQLLCSSGINVELVHRVPNRPLDVAGSVDFGENVQTHPVGSGKTGWRDKLEYIIFVIKLLSISVKQRPDVIIGYNTLGLLAGFLVKIFCPKIKLIYHNYDFDKSRLVDFLGRMEIFAARHADLTVFPSPDRAELYKALGSLSKEPVSVMNCYSLTYKLERTGELARILEERGLSFEKLVVRLGMIGPYHGIKSTLKSLPEWNSDCGFVMCGFSSQGYLKEIDQVIKELELENRVLVLPSVSNSLWYDVLAAADLGIALYSYDPNNIGHNFMAGTSQKLNGYFVKGIPSVVPNSPDFVSFVDKYGTSKCVEVSNPSSIAAAVNSMFENHSEYDRYRENVENVFLSEFNFEKQFEPVLRWIKDCK